MLIRCIAFTGDSKSSTSMQSTKEKPCMRLIQNNKKCLTNLSHEMSYTLRESIAYLDNIFMKVRTCLSDMDDNDRKYKLMKNKRYEGEMETLMSEQVKNGEGFGSKGGEEDEAKCKNVGTSEEEGGRDKKIVETVGKESTKVKGNSTREKKEDARNLKGRNSNGSENERSSGESSPNEGDSNKKNKTEECKECRSERNVNKSQRNVKKDKRGSDKIGNVRSPRDKMNKSKSFVNLLMDDEEIEQNLKGKPTDEKKRIKKTNESSLSIGGSRRVSRKNFKESGGKAEAQRKSGKKKKRLLKYKSETLTIHMDKEGVKNGEVQKQPKEKFSNSLWFNSDAKKKSQDTLRPVTYVSLKEKIKSKSTLSSGASSKLVTIPSGIDFPGRCKAQWNHNKLSQTQNKMDIARKVSEPADYVDILDEIKLSDVERFKSEYPRRDDMIPVPRKCIQDTLVYKMVYDNTLGLWDLLMRSRFSNLRLWSSDLSRTSTDAGTAPSFEQEKAKRRKVEAMNAISDLEQKIEAKKKYLESVKASYKGIGAEDVKRKLHTARIRLKTPHVYTVMYFTVDLNPKRFLRKYLLMDPGIVHYKEYTVMPVNVTGEKRMESFIEQEIIKAKLKPYMIDPLVSTCDKVYTVMPASTSGESGEKVRRRLCRKCEYDMQLNRQMTKAERNLWAHKYGKTPASHLLKYISSQDVPKFTCDNPVGVLNTAQVYSAAATPPKHSNFTITKRAVKANFRQSDAKGNKIVVGPVKSNVNTIVRNTTELMMQGSQDRVHVSRIQLFLIQLLAFQKNFFFFKNFGQLTIRRSLYSGAL